jgi:hypothetical protein
MPESLGSVDTANEKAPLRRKDHNVSETWPRDLETALARSNARRKLSLTHGYSIFAFVINSPRGVEFALQTANQSLEITITKYAPSRRC